MVLPCQECFQTLIYYKQKNISRLEKWSLLEANPSVSMIGDRRWALVGLRLVSPLFRALLSRNSIPFDSKKCVLWLRP